MENDDNNLLRILLKGYFLTNLLIELICTKQNIFTKIRQR